MLFEIKLKDYINELTQQHDDCYRWVNKSNERDDTEAARYHVEKAGTLRIIIDDLKKILEGANKQYE